MRITRTLGRLVGAVSIVGVLAGVAIAATWRPAPVEVRSVSDPVWLEALGDSEPSTPAEQDDPTETGGDSGGPSSAPPGTWIEAGLFGFELRTPETTAQVSAEIFAYRAARGLWSGDPNPNWPCVWGPGGSVFPGFASRSESLGAAMIQMMPDAVNFEGPAGSVTVVMVVADSFIHEGVEYPGQVANIGTKYCSPPPAVGPTAPPSLPVEPIPPVEPSEPPAEPTTPAGEPDPPPTP